jgi:hypothetical protein
MNGRVQYNTNSKLVYKQCGVIISMMYIDKTVKHESMNTMIYIRSLHFESYLNHNHIFESITL